MIETEKQCPICGKAFETNNPKQRKYCSPGCYLEAEKRRKRENYEKLHPDAVVTEACAYCGKPFERGHGRRYCSDECRYAAKILRKGMFKPRVCLECGITFTPKQGKESYCSVKCRTEANRKRAREYAKEYGKINIRGSAKPEPPKKPVILHNKPAQSVAEIAREAAEHGMTYGKYLIWRKQNEGA